MRRALAALTLLLYLSVYGPAGAGPHDEGTAAGHASLPAVTDAIATPQARTNVPGYTATPPQADLYRRPDLTARARSRVIDCQATSSVECEAVRGANQSANTPRERLSPHDPAIAAASRIARNPSLVLGSLSAFYSGCKTEQITHPERTIERVCNRYVGISRYACRRDLTVDVKRTTPNCTEGEWFAQGAADRNGKDHLAAQAQCRLQSDGKQRFRFYAWGGKGACIGWQTVDLPTEASTQALAVTDLAPHWEGRCWSPFKVVMSPGSGCTGTRCSYVFQFGTPQYACTAGRVPGDTITAHWNGDEPPRPGPADRCYLIQRPEADGCPTGTYRLADGSNRCAAESGTPALVGASGWSIPLVFDRPSLSHTETDQWRDACPALTKAGRCQAAATERCSDGPSTKVIAGRAVTRACWSFERTIICDDGAALNECEPLTAQGCTPVDSVCKQVNTATGQCERFQDRYRCRQAGETITETGSCPHNVFCLGESCFNTAASPDRDFARSMTLLEAAREAGVYLDVETLKVFSGEANRCRDRLLKNCCAAESSGAGMTNQSLFGVGSKLVYDILMNAENRAFVTQGLKALMVGSGFSGAFTSYGVTVAVNGTALPAGSVVLASNGPVVIAVDPWSLAIAVVIYAAMSMLSCNAEEAKVALKEGAKLCHTLGTWCSSCVRVAGKCVSCIERTTGKCCFNSKLARIINQQGRIQVGKGWGSPQSPDCSGFTIAELQRLDFSAMDLSEFYDSLQPALPALEPLQQHNQDRFGNCYYGQGKCR